MKKVCVYIMCMVCILSCESSDDSGEVSFSSYRYALWRSLINNQLEFNFVGTQIDEYLYPPYQGRIFDDQHEGIGAIETDGVLGNLNDVLQIIEEPDIVLIGIGINDMLQGDLPEPTANNVKAMVTLLQDYNPNVTIVIEQVPGLGPTYNTENLQNRVELYNDLLAEIENEFTTNTSRIKIVDMYSDFLLDYFIDDLHYNIRGANYIASKYYAAIADEISQNSEINILPLGDSRVVGYRNMTPIRSLRN